MEHNTGEKAINRNAFGNDFKWGVSVSAYQIEGAYDADDKSLSIWDVFTNRKGYKGHNGNVACDFYNNYRSDLQLLKSLNVPNFRFSLAWPRIFPAAGSYNSKGADYYNRIIDHCLELGIEPWVTLYHWDLPHYLEEKGGWANRDVVGRFEEYAERCARQFGDRVKHWMVLNEPLVFTGAGYYMGIHAPGKRGLRNFLPALHHAVLCQAQGGRILKELCPRAEVGSTFSCSHVEPYRNTEKDIIAAGKVDALLNRLFIEPALGLGYPFKELKILQRIEKFIKPGDEKLMAFDFDFTGIQNYTREVIKHSFFTPYLHASIVSAKSRKAPVTKMNWEIYPQSLYHVIKKYSAYQGVKKIYITENGAAFEDVLLQNGRINDLDRRSFIQDCVYQLYLAKNEGAKVNGYFIWSFLDNLEWSEGFHPRFGLVYVDFNSQKRIVKASGEWYRDFLANRALLH